MLGDFIVDFPNPNNPPPPPPPTPRRFDGVGGGVYSGIRLFVLARDRVGGGEVVAGGDGVVVVAVLGWRQPGFTRGVQGGGGEAARLGLQ